MTNIAYTIDGLGNRSQVSTNPPTPPTQVLYANDVVNQYTTVGGTARTHDSNGNLTDDGTYKFSYDFENRLVELRNSTTSVLIASYRYDALGRRVEKSVVGGATTRYVLDGVQVVEEFDGTNVWQARYVYEDGIDRPRCMDRADIADVNGNSNTTEVLRFHYHQQALGSVTELTQPTGAVVEWVTYDVYGLPTILNQVGTTVTQSAVGNPWLYTGREYDPESGLYFYRARTYDPGTGRFIQRDPQGYPDGLSAYVYGSASPTSRVDPLGLDDDLDQLRKDLEEAYKEEEQQVQGELREFEGEIGRLESTDSLRALNQMRRDLLRQREIAASNFKSAYGAYLDAEPDSKQKLIAEHTAALAELELRLLDEKLKLIDSAKQNIWARYEDQRDAGGSEHEERAGGQGATPAPTSTSPPPGVTPAVILFGPGGKIRRLHGVCKRSGRLVLMWDEAWGPAPDWVKGLSDPDAHYFGPNSQRDD